MSRPDRAYPYRSDRWVTPAVVVTGVIAAAVVVLGVAGLVAYLSVRGVDAGPLVQLVTAVLAAVGSLATLGLQLVGRRTQTKVERTTGRLASAVADQLIEVRPRSTRLPETATQPRGVYVPPGKHHQDSATAPGRQGE